MAESNLIPETDHREIPDIDDEDEEDDDEEVVIEEESNKFKREIHISTLNTQVQISSNYPKDDLCKLKRMTERIVDKYRE